MALSKEYQKIFNTICSEIANGHSLRAICSRKDMPSKELVRRWLRDDEDGKLVAQYARAREEQADFYADEIIEIADAAEDANLARLRVDARRWKASKLRPKVYGDKLAVGGADDMPPVQMEVATRADEFTRRIAGYASEEDS